MADASRKFSLEMGVQLSPKTQEIAKRELRESPEQIKESIEALKKLLEAEKDLYYSTDDAVLIRFLRPTKYYPESALALMRRAGEFKVNYAAHVKDIVPSDEEKAMEEPVVNVLLDRDQFGRRILMVNAGGLWNPKKVTIDQLFRIFYLIHVVATLEEETQVCGVVVLMDFSGLSMKQVTPIGPAFCVRLLTFVQDMMPLRLKGAHIVNQPFIFNMIFAMFKPFIKEKLKKRIFFHGTKMESLHEHISPECLPEDFGGSLPSVNYSCKDWYPVIFRCEDYVKEWNSWGIVPKK